MGHFRLAAMATVAASALVFTPVGVSSAAQVHQAPRATPLNATLTADTTTGTVYVASFSCPVSSNPMYEIACEMGVQVDIEAQEEEMVANELNQGAIVDGFSLSGYTANGLNTTILWAELG